MLNNITFREKSNCKTRIEKLNLHKETILKKGDYDIDDLQSNLKCKSIENVKEKNYDSSCQSEGSTISKKKDELISEISQMTLNFNYQVPQFNSDIEQIIENRLCLIKYPLISASSNIDADIFYIAKLREESMHSGGVLVEIKRNEIIGLRVICLNNEIWVAQSPRIYTLQGKLHIGDRIITVNGSLVNNLKTFQYLLRSVEKTAEIKLRLQRLPHAKIFAVKSTDYESLFTLNTNDQTISLNKAERLNNVNWEITEIGGISKNNYLKQIELENYCVRDQHRYIPIIMHPTSFLFGQKSNLT